MLKPANFLTFLRILGSVTMFFLPPCSAVFGVIYLLCGISDTADGFIARKTHTESDSGARLDSIADLVFLTVSAVKILPVIHPEKWIWGGIIGIAVLKICGMLVRFARYGIWEIPHTFFNKLTGLLLFLLPFSIPFIDIRYSVIPAGAAAVCAAVQDILTVKKDSDDKYDEKTI